VTAPLRTRLVAALMAVALLAVGSATALHLREVSSQLEAQLTDRADRALSSLATELTQQEERLHETLSGLSDAPRELARLTPDSPAAERYSQAAQHRRPGTLDILEVLDDDGTTLSSAHWPTRIDLLQPRFDPTPDGAHVRQVDTPTGPRPALIVVSQATISGHALQIVAGRWLEQSALSDARARLGVDRLSLRWRGGAVDAGGEPATSLTERHLTLRGPDDPELVVGVDRSDVQRLRSSLRLQALIVALLSALVALGVGLALSRGIVRPVEALATAASRLADGDLDARVPPGSSGVREVEDLVGAFNSMGDDLRSSQEQLVQAERVAAWREIARGLAHELKNPLTPIRASMDILRRARSLDRPDFDEILDEQAAAVVSEVARLKELSDSFARFARLPDPKPEPLDAGALLDEAAALYAHGVDVVRHITPAPISADRNQIATVLTNLVKNAVEAMEGEGTLTLSARRDGDEVEISVADDGPGIAPQIRDRLFTPYVTTKGSRGTGLGLAMAHRIVAEHRGRIEARDGQTGGATFVIRLPAFAGP
jgi:two-component system, NtrC family, nitrogen regulation sensor histidine kinase NtrY